MINDFIGGGQVFLHKLRMFLQVADKSLSVAFLISLLIVGGLKHKEIRHLDYAAAFVYAKAYIAEGFNEVSEGFKLASGRSSSRDQVRIKTSSKNGVVFYTLASDIIKDTRYIKAKDRAMSLGITLLVHLLCVCCSLLVLIFDLATVFRTKFYIAS